MHWSSRCNLSKEPDHRLSALLRTEVLSLQSAKCTEILASASIPSETHTPQKCPISLSRCNKSSGTYWRRYSRQSTLVPRGGSIYEEASRSTLGWLGKKHKSHPTSPSEPWQTLADGVSLSLFNFPNATSNLVDFEIKRRRAGAKLTMRRAASRLQQQQQGWGCTGTLECCEA